MVKIKNLNSRELFDRILGRSPIGRAALAEWEHRRLNARWTAADSEWFAGLLAKESAEPTENKREMSLPEWFAVQYLGLLNSWKTMRRPIDTAMLQENRLLFNELLARRAISDPGAGISDCEFLLAAAETNLKFNCEETPQMASDDTLALLNPGTEFSMASVLHEPQTSVERLNWVRDQLPELGQMVYSAFLLTHVAGRTVPETARLLSSGKNRVNTLDVNAWLAAVVQKK